MSRPTNYFEMFVLALFYDVTLTPYCFCSLQMYAYITSVESQKGAVTIQGCSVENQKGATVKRHCTSDIVPFWISTDDM